MYLKVKGDRRLTKQNKVVPIGVYSFKGGIIYVKLGILKVKICLHLLNFPNFAFLEGFIKKKYGSWGKIRVSC